MFSHISAACISDRWPYLLSQLACTPWGGCEDRNKSRWLPVSYGNQVSRGILSKHQYHTFSSKLKILIWLLPSLDKTFGIEPGSPCQSSLPLHQRASHTHSVTQSHTHNHTQSHTLSPYANCTLWSWCFHPCLLPALTSLTLCRANVSNF